MGGRADPPDGMPPGGEDEFRSTVFDESFVREARLREYSARERMDPEHREHPVHSLPGRTAGVGATSARQGLILLALIVLAFGTAIYMGLTSPYEPGTAAGSQPLRATVVPLSPRGPVPAGEPGQLLAHSPAADFRVGAAGVTLPAAPATRDFSDSQVLAALSLAKEYVVASSIDSRVLTGSTVTPVRELLTTDQRARLDRSLREAPGSGWLVRFDTQDVALGDAGVRVRGALTVAQRGRDVLEVSADHVFVYALRAAGETDERRHSLFTVRRTVRMAMEREDLTAQRLRVEHVVMQAGPLACGAADIDLLRPLSAGESAAEQDVRGTDPYDTRPASSPVCGVLAEAARPSPPGG